MTVTPYCIYGEERKTTFHNVLICIAKNSPKFSMYCLSAQTVLTVFGGRVPPEDTGIKDYNSMN